MTGPAKVLVHAQGFALFKDPPPSRCDPLRRAWLDATPDFPAAAVVERHVPVVVDFHDELHFMAR